MTSLNTIRAISRAPKMGVLNGSSGFEVSEEVEISSRYERILARRRQSQVMRGGFAPDLVHGSAELGTIYDVVPEAEVESLIFFTTLNLGAGVMLATFGRWAGGFLDTIQVIFEEGRPTTAEVEMAIVEYVEDCEAVLGLTPADFNNLRGWLTSMGRADLVEKINMYTRLPVALNKNNLLAQERDTLGLVREDLVDPAEIIAIRDGALSGNVPLSRQRIRDAGRADLLAGVALFIERRRRSL